MSDHDQHGARMAAGTAALTMIEALADDDVEQATMDLAVEAVALRVLLTTHGVPAAPALGFVVGLIIAAMNEA